jgi:hypothetical protein
MRYARVVLLLIFAALPLLWDQSACGQLLADAPIVLIDLSHSSWKLDASSPYGISKLIALLQTQGFDVATLREGPLTPALLAGVGVLVIMEPSAASPYSEPEIAAVREFVAHGGGFLLGAEPLKSPTQPSIGAYPLALAFGASYRHNGFVLAPRDYSSITAGWSDREAAKVLRVSPSTGHPVTEGIDFFYAYGSTYLDTLGSAVIIAETATNSWFDTFGQSDYGNGVRDQAELAGPFPVLAAMNYGLGSVVLIGDGVSISNSWIDMPGNRQLVLNAVAWLKPGARPLEFASGGSIRFGDYDLREVPLLHCASARGRPYTSILLSQDGESWMMLPDVLLDSGADISVFPTWVAEALGIDLSECEQGIASGVGGTTTTYTVEIYIAVVHMGGIEADVDGYILASAGEPLLIKARVAFTPDEANAETYLLGRRDIFDALTLTFEGDTATVMPTGQ